MKHIERMSEILGAVAFKDHTQRNQVATDLVKLIEDISGMGQRTDKATKVSPYDGIIDDVKKTKK